MGSAWLPLGLGLALLLAAEAPAAARPGPPRSAIRAGREIAEDVCSACHVVADQQEFPPTLQQHVRSFQEIADDPATTAKTLRHFVMTTHWDEKTVPMKMPDLSLTKDQAQEVTSYILSLRKMR